MTDRPDSFQFAASGRRVLAIEAEALGAVAARIGSEFEAACQAMLACRGRVVCTGMGKSGHVARKIAATVKALGAARFQMKYSSGPLPHEKMMRSIELYGGRVIPAAREILAEKLELS